MDNVLLYWIIEYIKVFLGYGFIMFIWPLVVFRKFLSGKSVTFKFCFCSTAQIVIINSVVLMLGVIHLLNKWTMWAFFYGMLIWSLREYFVLTEDRKKTLRYLFTGTMGWKHFVYRISGNLWLAIKNKVKKFKKFYARHYIEYTSLIIVLVYAWIYFSHGAFTNYSYGFSDLYVHHAWIYGLIQGEIFSAGVYPEGMHCFVYCIYELTGISVYSCLHFMQTIHVITILLSAYCFLKAIFKWRFSAIFTIVLFLIVDFKCINEVASMSRLQCSLPQEFGFHAMYICALFLNYYLKRYKKTVIKGVELKACWDEYLLVFMLALSVTIMVHFYVTIMAFFLCFAFAVFALRHVFHRKHLVPLIVSVVIGLIVATIPMACSLAQGNRFQGSIGWALNVMKGSDNQQSQSTNTSNTDTDQEENITNTISDSNAVIGNATTSHNNIILSDDIENTDAVNLSSVSEDKQGLTDKPQNKVKSLGKFLENKLSIIFKRGYTVLYGETRAKLIAGCSLLVILLYFVYRVISLFYYKVIKRSKEVLNLYPTYLPTVFLSFIFMLLYAAKAVGLPALIDGLRICSTGNMIILAVLMLPIDMLFSVFIPHQREELLGIFSVFISIGLVVLVCLTGSYHGYLYFDLTRYNAPVVVTNRIMSSLPDNTYTIVSTTDELYQVIQNGRHEEILTFVKNQNKDIYTIPTEYLFIYVEKKPIKYAQSHYFPGPKWLAMEKYHKMYSSNCSYGTDIISSQISDEYADESIMYFNKPSKSYSNLESRTILESKMYLWCQEFEQMYPNELKVFYEDDDFICYYIQQNPQFLFNLAIP